MGRIGIEEIVDREYLRCPKCKGKVFLKVENQRRTLRCPQCFIDYPIINNIPVMMGGVQDKAKEDIQAFWKSLYDACYLEKDQKMDKEEFIFLLGEVEKLFYHRQHLAITEMPISDLKDKMVLEIGSGNGVHSAYFSSLGAKMYSMDISFERVIATAQKLDFIENNNDNICLQGDAEFLPFENEFFDIIFSNGVLHHTPRTDKAIDEVYRVLKPGGRAVIMLYAKNSFKYWVILFFLKGVLYRNLFKNKNWLGRVTEWMSNKKQEVYNPVTKVYSQKDIQLLFNKFDQVKIRQNSFEFHQIPKLGKYISRILAGKTGVNQGGVLLYGGPWRNETRFELWLGQHLGIGLNIVATK